MAGLQQTQIGGLQPTTQPSGLLPQGAQIAQALGQIPAMLHNARVQREQQAQQQQVQALQMEAQKAKLGDQLYGQIAEIITADPTKRNDPALLKRARDIQRATGRPVAFVTDEHGNQVLDVDALRGIPDWETLDPAKRIELGLKIVQQPKDQRAGLIGKMRNVPPELLNAEQHIQPSAGAITAAQQQLGRWGEELSAGKLDPTRFAGLVNANAGTYKAMGIDTSGLLSPEFLEAGVSKFANAQIDWIHQKGIHLENADALAKKIADDKRQETFKRLQLTGAQLQEHIREFDAKEHRLWAQHQDNLSVSLQRLSNAQRSLDERISNQAFMRNITTVGALSKITGDLRSQYNAAQTQLVSTGKAIGSLAGQGMAVPEILQKQYDALQARVNEIGPQLGTYDLIVQKAVGGALSGVTGVPTRPVAPPQTPTEAPKTKVNPANGKTYYLHADGNYYLKP